MNPFLTVVIPVFNDETNILRCLESLFNQTFLNMEIIVINDASTDNTLAVLEDYRKHHTFTIINVEKNSGAGYCRNLGIQMARTPYVTFVDSDDWVDISVYTRCFEQSFENPDVIIFGLTYDYVSHNHREDKYRYTKIYKMSGEFALSAYAHTIPNEIRITPIVNNKIYRRQFLLEKRLSFHEELRYQEDDAFTFEVLARAATVVIVNDCFYHYCQRNNSLIHSVSEYSIRNFVNAYLLLEENLKASDLFDKNKSAFYLKLKGSLIGVLQRILDYELDTRERNELIHLLLVLLIENFDFLEVLDTFDFSTIRSIL